MEINKHMVDSDTQNLRINSPRRCEEMEMEINKHMVDSDTQNLRKRKRKQEGIDALRVDKQNAVLGIDKLPDDMLIAILSRMSLKDAVRTSVLASRWRYLWTFRRGELEFDDGNNSTGTKIKRKKFKTWVNSVLKLHQGEGVDSLVIRFTNLRLRPRSSHIDSWIYFAVQKEVKKFELDLSVEDEFHCCYKFPNIEKLLSSMHEVKKSSAFVSLRSLRLVDVDIEDEVVQYLLASCHFIEYLCIRVSDATRNLQVVDPLPNLKELEISDCSNIESLVISATNLVSCTYQGRVINVPFKENPNLTELTLGGWFSESFILEPDEYRSYSAQLVKLVLNFNAMGQLVEYVPPDLPQLFSLKRLELNIMLYDGESPLFVASLIKASPNLQELKIEIEYLFFNYRRMMMLFHSNPLSAELQFPHVENDFCHKNLKVVEMVGFQGSLYETKFLAQLIKVAPSLDTVLIDTKGLFHRVHHDIMRELLDTSASLLIKNSPSKITFTLK